VVVVVVVVVEPAVVGVVDVVCVVVAQATNAIPAKSKVSKTKTFFINSLLYLFFFFKINLIQKC